MKDFYNFIIDWKVNSIYAMVGGGTHAVTQAVSDDVIHFGWALFAAFLSPIFAYFGKKVLGILKEKFNF